MMIAGAHHHDRIVITGIGLTAPNGNNLGEFRANLLAGRSGVSPYEIRYVGKTVAGVCNFDELRYQKRKDLRRGTRAASIGIYCAHEAIADSGIDWPNVDRSQVGIYIGVTEHGNVETENEIHELKGFDYDTKFWSHHHNPRTVANNPAGEISLNLGITGPHYAIGAACAAGNAGIIQGAQMLRLRECDVALAGGVSESIHTFGIFASFKSQGALASHDDPARASRPFDAERNGIVVAEGGCLYVLERYDDARRRGAKIYGEIAGYAMNSDASDFVLPNPARQAECMGLAMRRAGLNASDVDIVSTHATGTTGGDVQECLALRQVFDNSAAHAHQQRQELHRPHDGRRRRTGTGRQSAGLRRRRLPRHDQRRRARSPVCLERAGDRPAARAGPGRRDSEQFVRHAGHQFRRHRQAHLRGTENLGHETCRNQRNVLDILENIAPDEDLSGLKDDVPLREQLELDSMDFLDIVMELRKRYRVQIPEDDYVELATMQSTVNYLAPLMKDLEKVLRLAPRSAPPPHSRPCPVRHDHHRRRNVGPGCRHSLGALRPARVHSRTAHHDRRAEFATIAWAGATTTSACTR